MKISTLFKTLFFCTAILSIGSSSGKVLTRCEFATKLKPLLDAENWGRLGDWICAAEGLSGIDTSIRTTSSADPDSRSYGVLQINNQWWCLDDASHSNPVFANPCKKNCSDFLDEDLADDIECGLKIQQSETTLFQAWNGWVNRCKGKNLDEFRYLDKCPVTEQPTVPKIQISASANVTFTDGARDQYIYCRAKGTPDPELSWEYDKKAFPELRSQKLTHEPVPTVRLIFPTVSSFYAGRYTCVAHNFFGRANQTYFLHVKPGAGAGAGGPTATTYGLAVGLPLVVLLVVLAAGALYYVRQVVLKLNGLTEAEIREFLQGNPDRLKATTAAVGGDGDGDQAPLHENIHYQPYDKEFDIAKGRLKTDNTRILGEGQYGFVTKAELDGAPVAVKAVKPNTDKLYIKALLSELKIMIHLGKHENIVGLIGAVTNELNKGMLLIVVEFCELGDLTGFLRARKHCFVATGDEAYQNTMGQEYENSGTITTTHLTTWCQQIAQGMEYLASKKVIHGDLAARNVLLTSALQAKITDFGLSRQLYDYTNYVKKQQAPLPWRHMAIESLREMSFSTESDVWAFGVIMWEVFSLGDVPYPGRSWSLDFVHELENGLRLLQPKHSPDAVYETMKGCWSWSKYERPQFGALVAQLGVKSKD